MWLEDEQATAAVVSAEVADLAFRLRGRTLPVEHALALRDAVASVLPWLAEHPQAGIHAVHVAASGNGWLRPDSPHGAPLSLSRRTRLVLRLPRALLDDARALEGRELDVAGHPLEVGEARVRDLTPSETLFARYVAHPPHEDEPDFVARVADELGARGLRVRKLLCGQAHRLRSPGGTLHTRSMMVADLAADDSLRLQEQGLGEGRTLGCGLFVHHKSIAPVRAGGAE